MPSRWRRRSRRHSRRDALAAAACAARRERSATAHHATPHHIPKAGAFTPFPLLRKRSATTTAHAGHPSGQRAFVCTVRGRVEAQRGHARDEARLSALNRMKEGDYSRLHAAGRGQRVAHRGPCQPNRARRIAGGGGATAQSRPPNCGRRSAGGGLRLADCGFCRKRLDIMANLQLNSRFLTIICGECRVGERFVARDAGPCDSALWAQWRRYLCYPSSSRYFARIVIGDAPRRLSELVSGCDTRRILLAALGSLPEIFAKNRRLGCRN